jgi:hypothetical protein
MLIPKGARTGESENEMHVPSVRQKILRTGPVRQILLASLRHSMAKTQWVRASSTPE